MLVSLFENKRSKSAHRGFDEYHDARVTVLSEHVRHHMGQEENPGGEALES